MAIGSPSTVDLLCPSGFSLPAGVLASAHQGSRLNPGSSNPSSEGSSRTSPSVSGLLQQSLPHPEGFGVVAPHHWLLTLNDYVTSSLSTWRLHSQTFIPFAQATGWSLWLCRTPTCRFLSSRFASLSSLRGGKKDVPVRGPLLRSHTLAPSLHEDYDSHFRHPPQVWTIDSSWPLQNSSLVYLGVEIRSLPFLVRPPPDESAPPATTRGVSVNPISSSVPLAWYPGPQGPLEFPGRPVSGLLVPSLSRVSSLVDSSGPAA